MLVVTLYTNANSALGTDGKSETGDGQINRTWKERPVEVILTEFQNIPECHIRDGSRFSRPTVGSYAKGVGNAHL